MPIMYVCPLLYMHFLALLLRRQNFLWFSYSSLFRFVPHTHSSVVVFLSSSVFIVHALCCQRNDSAVNNKHAGQNSELSKKFSFSFSFRLVYVLEQSSSLSLSHFQCFYVSSELLPLGQALFLSFRLFILVHSWCTCNMCALHFVLYNFQTFLPFVIFLLLCLSFWHSFLKTYNFSALLFRRPFVSFISRSPIDSNAFPTWFYLPLICVLASVWLYVRVRV